jgi:hypothetical protein
MNIYRISYEYMIYGELGYSDLWESSALVVAETEEAAQLIYPPPETGGESTTLTIKLIGLAVEGVKAGFLR